MKNKYLYILGSIVLLGVLFLVVGFTSSSKMIANYYEIEKDFEINMAQITDTHFDDKFNRDDYDLLIDTINSEDIDVLVFTGDLFQVRSVSEGLEEDVVALLSELDADYKLAVLGNHDYNDYAEYRVEVVRILEASGFTVLFNEAISYEINGSVYNFLGFEDLMYGNSNYTPVLNEIDENAINFVLSHEPDTFDDVTNENIEAMFSGHSHGGQIRLPFVGALYHVPGARIYNDENHYEVNEKDLYISFGLGESALKIRFFCNREFEIYNYS